MKRISMMLVLALITLSCSFISETDRYCGIGEVIHTSETISYSDRVDTEERMGSDFPAYEVLYTKMLVLSLRELSC